MRFRIPLAFLPLVAVLAAPGADLKKLGLDQPLDPLLQPALAPVAEQPGLPRVLLLGDSISIGYTLGVRQALAGRANVVRPPENCGPTIYGLERLDAWLGEGKWAVIHFNFGLHDLKYLDASGRYITPRAGDAPLATPEQYADQLRRIIGRLQRTGARLVLATTTPVPAGTLGRLAGSERAYNDAALAVARAEGVAVDDLWAFASAHPDFQRPQNVHFTTEGSAALARVVAASVAAQLPAPVSP